MKNLTDLLSNFLIDRNRWNKRICVLSLILLGIALPFLLVTYIDYYSWGDVETFRSWSDCWGQQIYAAYCSKLPPNYPVVGLTVSAGLINTISSIFGITERNTSILIFRYCLAFIDALNFLLFVLLASLMRFRHPIHIGLILLMMPSTWVGSAVWGQIDGILLFFCLLSVIGFFKAWLASGVEAGSQKAWKSGIYLLLGILSFCLYLLTKQLALFSLPFFFILFLITVWKFWKSFRYRSLFWLSLALIVFILCFRYIDSFFEVPEQFHHSSYWFVLKGAGSEYGNKISVNGFNLWMFLGLDMSSSSHVPFFTLELGSWMDPISPYKAGIISYSIFIAFLLLTAFKGASTILKKNVWIEQKDKLESHLMALLCFFHGFCHLGFNVLLCGTHERYLYLGYPFLLISVAWFYTNQLVFSRQPAICCFLAAAAYGCFVFSFIKGLPPLLFPLRRHEFLASIHLFLLVFLLDQWMLICQLNPKNSSASLQVDRHIALPNKALD
ncbi:hypothetical protein [Stenomitos frigidus]|uniref:Glycosyltransferase RgtA/B/C/D-like domain-containing protein n=1 Tax=Stenomitos frigidus ULC18 TaxID=2107698 RepID=A0A2T1E293_9CYAN|nr:hypothetical protein [Stenomitos frigidus]PSB26857.1 hypothetical protein C7B82_18585 [Stenomitos frigidus ULC18]